MQSIPDKVTALRCQQDNPNEGSNLRDTFKVQQLETPDDLQGRECLVEIKAMSLGAADIACLPYMRKGAVPGWDFAGVIRKCDSGVWKEGERVAGISLGGLSDTLRGGGDVKRFQPQGAAATYVRTLCDLVMRIPDNVDFQEASTLAGCFLIAYQSFNLKSWPHDVKSHEPIVVFGADTTIGLSVVQLAHCCGHRVIAVAESDHRKRVEENGADVFIDRDSGELAEKVRHASQNNLKYAVITTYMDNVLEIATESMPKGGEISITPWLLAQFGGQQMKMDRGNVKVTERTHATLFGLEAEMNGKTFKPMNNETENAYKFLKDVTRWLQEKKLRVLPFETVQQQGIEGLEQAMQEIKNNGDKFWYKRLVSTISGGQGQKRM